MNAFIVRHPLVDRQLLHALRGKGASAPQKEREFHSHNFGREAIPRLAGAWRRPCLPVKALLAKTSLRLGPDGCRIVQPGALGGEADFGEAHENEVEDGRGALLGLESGVAVPVVFRFAKVTPSDFVCGTRADARRGVGGISEAFFQGTGVSVFSRWGDPDHDVGAD